MKKYLLLFILITSYNLEFISQQMADVTVTVSRVQDDHECGCNDGGAFQCGIFNSQPDPSWRIRSQYLGGVYSPVTFIEYENQNCTSRSRSDIVDTYTGICASQLVIEIESWEDDGCGANSTYNTGCVNNDADHSAPQTFTINYQLDPAGQNNTYAYTLSNGYQVDIDVFWTVSTIIGSPSVSGATTICSGAALSLTASDPGSTGYNWYTVAAGGTPISTGSNLNVSGLTANTTYYVAGSVGACEGPRTQVDVTINSNSVAATSLSPSVATICSSGLVDFTVVGGSLGTGATWELYSTSCGGTLIGTSAVGIFNSINVTSTETYYVLANGTCNTTACVSTTVVVDAPSVAATSLSPSVATMCSPGTVDFTVIGGSLGTGATWELYSGSCGGTLEGSSITGIFTGIPFSSTQTYYILATGICNTTVCVDTIVTLETLSTAPTDIIASDTIICAGDLVSLNASGGLLGTGASWHWYSGTCGGTSVASGSSIVVNPSVTTDYFLRAEGNCDTTTCVNVTISVTPNALDIDSAFASVYSVCPSDPVQLNAYYTGSLSSNYSVTWFTAACGAIPIGVGDSIVINPIDTTIYYVQTIGTCGVSFCDTVKVNVQPGSIDPTGIIASINNFCIGNSTTLSVDGGSLVSGASWTWYEGNCGGAAIGTGTSIIVTPNASTMYYVRATGGSCGNTSCASLLVNIYTNTVYLVPFDTLCMDANSSGLTLTGGIPTGGVYSGVGVSNGIFDPNTAGVGTHSITYTYTNSFGCIDSVAENLVVLESNPSPINILATGRSICNGSSTRIWLDSLSNTLYSGRMWVWYEGACGAGVPIDTTYNDTTIGDTSIVVSPTTTTNYYVRAEGGICDPSECIGITIDVHDLETDLLVQDSVCGIDVPAFLLTGGIPSGGTFSGTGVINDYFDPMIAGLGTHIITYTYSLGGCTVTDTEPLTVTSSPINVYSSIEQESCSDGGILIHLHTTGGSGYYSYYWSDGSIDNPLMYAQAGTYSVLVSDANKCVSSLDSIDVADSLACIEMPNTFTPNADGINDTWNLDFTTYNTASLIVFSKWGNIVAEFSSLTISWDGVYEGEPLPAGTYYYILKLNDNIEQNGPITIVR